MFLVSVQPARGHRYSSSIHKGDGIFIDSDSPYVALNPITNLCGCNYNTGMIVLVSTVGT